MTEIGEKRAFLAIFEAKIFLGYWNSKDFLNKLSPMLWGRESNISYLDFREETSGLCMIWHFYFTQSLQTLVMGLNILPLSIIFQWRVYGTAGLFSFKVYLWLMKIDMSICQYSKIKQAENSLQSWSSENGKIAVLHYGLKLQWYLTWNRDWRYGMVWYGLIWGSDEFIHEEISIMDYNELSWLA